MISLKKCILPLILLNITISANIWDIFGISIGQILYWILIFLIFNELRKSRFYAINNFLFLFLIISKLLSIFINLEFISIISELFAGIHFILGGVVIFGEKRELLFKQLLFYFFLSIPFLVIQKIGLHSIFYAWNTEMFHLNDVYDFDLTSETGKIFKNIKLYNTLFTSKEDLIYVMYQARPTGLSYSNNVLSLILVTSLALSIFIKNKKQKAFSNFILPISAVLLMSTLVYSICFIIFIFYKKNKNFNLSLVISLILHYLFFPGLTESSFGLINLISFISRFGEIFQLLGYSELVELSSNILTNDVPINLEFTENSFSLFGQFFRFKYWFLTIPLIFFIIIYFIIRVKNISKTNKLYTKPYTTLLLFLVLTQFAIPFIKAPFFQLLFGVSIYPLFHYNKMFLKKYTL